jgi:hypothetical protein
MFELTSAQYRFRQAVPEGDFYEALGLSPKATSLDVDVAGARLAEQAPSMAAEVSRVVNVLTHRQRKTLYDAVRKVRDDVSESLVSLYGAEFSRTIPNFRLDLWGRCCRLFRFDLTSDGQKLSENGRGALAQAGPGWIVRELLDVYVTKLEFTESERISGRARRDVWHAQCRCRGSTRVFLAPRNQPTSQNAGQETLPEQYKADAYMRWPATCPRCNQVYQPTHFDDRLKFALPAGPLHGEVIRGESDRGGPTFVVAGAAVGQRAPKEVLERFFALQNEGKDVTLKEAERDFWKRQSRKPTAASKPATSGKFPIWIIVAVLAIAGRLISSMDHSEKSATDWSQPKLKSPDFRSIPQIPGIDSGKFIEDDVERMFKSRNSPYSPVPKSQSTFPDMKPLDSPEKQSPQPQSTLPLSPPASRPELTLPDNGKQPESSASP